MTDRLLREQRDATLALLDRLIRRGRELHSTSAALNGPPSDSRSAGHSGPRSAEIQIWQADCAAAVNELSGGSKAHWLSRAYSNALLVRSPDGGAVVSADPAEIVDRILNVLEQAARSLSDLDATGAGAAAEPPPRRFAFVHDALLQPVLEQALVESGRAFDSGDYTRALMTTCGILEAIITDALRLARPEPFDSPLILSPSKDERLAQDVLVAPRQAQGDPEVARRVEGRARSGQAPVEPHDRPISDWSFEQRIAAAEQAGLIRGGCARLPAAARAYRDAPIGAAVTERDARLAAQVLRVVMRDLDPGR